MSPFLSRLLLCWVLSTTGVSAETLALPTRLIDLSSDQGEALLLETKPLDAYLPISVAFETQKTQAYCGVASIVMTLNALKTPAPSSPPYQPYAVFTQDNVLDQRTEAVLPRDVLARQGMTLDQLGGLLALHPLLVEVHHAVSGGLDTFRKTAGDYLSTRGHVVIVNYLRKSLDQERGGHISPLAAYDAKADRFLILDVARYKYPPVWVTASDLFDAMNTIDADNDGKTRGYVLVANGAGAQR
ncbi:phytochelatin synthase family protein [Lichenihabitans psoromatis]|uniref:phytochelatin synthase family protein n=1 Tax=Lichenihabitans psoromatis TaxID=2528642 RepID=UPI001035EFAE|nr:phytochelatin synthase family protein [Lichenihabitans psoromatis]